MKKETRKQKSVNELLQDSEGWEEGFVRSNEKSTNFVTTIAIGAWKSGRITEVAGLTGFSDENLTEDLAQRDEKSCLNPFTPKSNQIQISSTASPEI